MIKNNLLISQYEFLNSFLTKKCQIIDIRDYQSFLSAHIPSSINIPEDLLLSNPNLYLSKELSYCIICRRGISSEEVAMKLYQLGFNVKSVSGGIVNWRGPLVKGVK